MWFSPFTKILGPCKLYLGAVIILVFPVDGEEAVDVSASLDASWFLCEPRPPDDDRSLRVGEGLTSIIVMQVYVF